MTSGRTVFDPITARLAQLRAEIGSEPLVSHAQDAVGAQIGGAVFERVPWDANKAKSGRTQ